MKKKLSYPLVVFIASAFIACFASCSKDSGGGSAPSNSGMQGVWHVLGGYDVYDTNGNWTSEIVTLNTPLGRQGIWYLKFTDTQTTMADGSQGYVLEAETRDHQKTYHTWKLNGNRLEGSLISAEVEFSQLSSTIKTCKVIFTTPDMPSDVSHYSYTLSYQWIDKSDFVGTWKGSNDTWEFYYYFNDDGTGWGEGYSRTGSEMRWEFTYVFTEGNEEGVAKCVGASGYVGFDGEVNLNNKFETTFVLGNHGLTLKGGDYSNVEFEKMN